MTGKKSTVLAAAGAMAVLILDTRCAAKGAAEGIDLCIRTVIPALFPFFVISILLSGSICHWKLMYPLGRLFRVPKGSEAILFTGLLGGYPVGAQTAAEGFRRGNLSLGDANRLLSFCSQAGPSFLFGIAAGLFPSAIYGWLLWGIQLLSAWVVSLLSKPEQESCRFLPEKSQITLPQALGQAVTVMGEVCGWIVLFRVVMAFLERWLLWLLPAEVSVGLKGILELTNGCLALKDIASLPLRFTLCAMMLNFGGLCVAMQTVSVTQGLDFRYYLRGKLLQCFISAVLCGVFFGKMYLMLPLGLAATVLAFTLFRKKGGNPAAVGV